MKNIVLQIAKQAIQDSFLGQKTIEKDALIKIYPWLNEDGASFVTLTKEGNLRGCIGSLVARRPLIEDIIDNANSAAFKDPRFSKLTPVEFQEIAIEVSILTPPVLVNYTDTQDLKKKITPNVDGIILSLDGYQATFLPQVWEQLPEFELFFGHLLNKAGLPMDSFKNHPTIYKYNVKKFKA